MDSDGVWTLRVAMPSERGTVVAAVGRAAVRVFGAAVAALPRSASTARLRAVASLTLTWIPFTGLRAGLSGTGAPHMLPPP